MFAGGNYKEFLGRLEIWIMKSQGDFIAFCFICICCFCNRSIRPH